MRATGTLQAAAYSCAYAIHKGQQIHTDAILQFVKKALTASITKNSIKHSMARSNELGTINLAE